MASTKEVQIDWQGRPERVVLKRLTFGEKNRLAEESTEIRLIAGQPNAKVSISAMKELGLLKSIITAPFPITLEQIRNLDPDTGELLFNEFQSLNNLDEKKGEASGN